MKVSSTYLSQNDDFSDVDPNTISLKYSVYIFTNTGDNGQTYSQSFLLVYVSNPFLKSVISTQKVNISIRLSIRMLVCSSSKGSAANLFRTTVSVSSVGTLVNRLTTSRLTIWLE